MFFIKALKTRTISINEIYVNISKITNTKKKISISIKMIQHLKIQLKLKFDKKIIKMISNAYQLIISDICSNIQLSVSLYLKSIIIK